MPRAKKRLVACYVFLIPIFCYYKKLHFFRLSPFYQPQKSVPPERSRKHNFKSKICFSLLDHVSFFSSTPQNSEQAPHFQSKAPHSLLLTPQSKRKTTPSQIGCDSDLVSINFCVATHIRIIRTLSEQERRSDFLFLSNIRISMQRNRRSPCGRWNVHCPQGLWLCRLFGRCSLFLSFFPFCLPFLILLLAFFRFKESRNRRIKGMNDCFYLVPWNT